MDDDFKAARIFGLLPVSTIQSNKTKIQSFTTPPNPSMYDGSDIVNPTIQKTSIKIKSSEFSSTVNVNDRKKLYHTSVLIKDHSDQSDLNRINDRADLECVGNSTNISGQKVKDLVNNLSPVDTKTEIAISYTNMKDIKETEILEVISSNGNKTKTLISLDYKNNLNDILPKQNSTEAKLLNESSETKSIDIMKDSKSGQSSKLFVDSFILKLLNDPYSNKLLYGLEIQTIANIIEKSLARLPLNKCKKDTETDKLLLKRLYEIIKEERYKTEHKNCRAPETPTSSENLIYTNLLELAEYSKEKCCDSRNRICNGNDMIPIRKIYELLTDSSFWKNNEHQYESICTHSDPIYEEINEKPPPLPVNPPPMKSENPEKQYKPMFLGATKYDILSYLINAKERIIVPEESYTFKFLRRSTESNSSENLLDSNEKTINTTQQTLRNIHENKNQVDKITTTTIERNDSGVGSETSKSSRTKYHPGTIENDIVPPIHLCEDCGKFIAENNKKSIGKQLNILLKNISNLPLLQIINVIDFLH